MVDNFSLVRAVLFLAFTGLLGYYLRAQPVISAASGWAPGNSINFHTADTSGIHPGSSGAGIAWDFSTLQFTEAYIYNTPVHDPADTPYDSLFPDATYAREPVSDLYYYYEVDSQELNYWGYADATFSFVLQDPLSLFKYPLRYGSITSDDFGLSTYDYFGDERTYFGTSDIEVDGYGTLYLPDVVLNNVVRVKVTTNELDYEIGGSDTVKVYNETYYWYSPAVRGTVLFLVTGYRDINGFVTDLKQVHYRAEPFDLDLDFTFTDRCAGKATTFQFQATHLDSVSWDFGDPDSGHENHDTIPAPKHIYGSPGNYTVSVTGYSGTKSTTITKTINIEQLVDFQLPGSDGLCGGSYIIDATTDNASYRWQDNSTGPTFTAMDTGLYWVEVDITDVCTIRDSIRLGDCVDNLFIPTLFTPNGDGSNDRFRIHGSGISELQWQIYNRWGELVYETNSVEEATNAGWDGLYKGVITDNASFVWYLKGSFYSGAELQFNGKKTGKVLLLR